MPEIPNRREQDFSRYDAMDDSVLQDILRSDASKPEGEESDIEELLYVMELLAKRRAERGESRDPQKAFEKFKKYYAPTEEAVVVNGDTDAPARIAALPEQSKSASGWRRKLVIVAAATILLVAGALTAGAAKLDLFEAIAKWTKETFRLGLIAETGEAWDAEGEINLPFYDLKELLLANNISSELVPTWLPEGFELSDVGMDETPQKRVFWVHYTNHGKNIVLELSDNFFGSPLQYEQLDSMLEIYQSGKNHFYIFKNDIQLQAVCFLNNLECWIYGDLSLADIRQIIDSIGKG